MECLPQTLRTRRTRSKETAIDAFIQHKAEIDSALERLATLSADHFNVSPELDFGLFTPRKRVHFPFGSRYGGEFLYCPGLAGT
jgi:hypothetical protein